MTQSFNGWNAGSREAAHIVTRTVPGTKVQLPINADAADLLIWAAVQWNTRVEKLGAGCWGYADRLVRGSTTTVSNHASGTAIDLNAPKHPRGVPTARTLSAKQIGTVHAFLAKANEGHHVLDWGGDYRRSEPDAMHIEIAQGATQGQVHAAAARLNVKPLKVGKPLTLFMHAPKGPLHVYWIKEAQKALKIPVTGVFDHAMRRAVIQYRKRNKLGRPYGVVGPRVWQHLGVK